MIVLALVLGIALGISIYRNLTVTQWGIAAPGRLFSADTPLPLEALSNLESEDDETTLAAISVYFNDHQAQIASAFQEANPERLKALWVMYEIHTSHIFGGADQSIAHLTDYLHSTYSDCGTSARWQSVILTSLDIQNRVIAISGGTHVFVEVLIGNHWEIFDSTINIWISASAFEMERGAPRTIRTFYTPAYDSRWVDEFKNGDLGTLQELRFDLPLLGLQWFPKAYFSVG